MIISDFLRVSGQTENSVLPSVLIVSVPYDIHVKVMENTLLVTFNYVHCTHLPMEWPLLVPESSGCHKLPPYAKTQSTSVTFLLGPNSVRHNPTE